MHLRVDPNSGEPLAVQIARQIRLAVAAGRVAAGDRLPGSRELAADLGVNFHTVRKAYAALEAEGLLRTEHGTGTFVAEGARPLGAADLRALVRRHLEALAQDLAGAPFEGTRVEQVLLDEWARLLGARKERP
jgi:GntR family transcriptional regulator